MMTNAFSKADHFLSKVRLPSLSPAIMRLIDLCNDPEIELATVGQAVAQDVALTGRVLSLANSAFLGSRLPFHEINQAVVFLGSDTIRNLAISTAIHDAFTDRQTSARFRLKEFWYHSLLCGLLAKGLAEQCGHESPSRAYLAGLLHDLGKCLLATTLPREYDQLHGDGQDSEITVQEKQTFGLTHAEAGMLLLTKWQLSPGVIAIVRYHHDETLGDGSRDELHTIIAIANFLAGGKPYPGFELQDALAILNLQSGKIENLVNRQKEQINDLAHSLGIKIKEPTTEQLEHQQEEQQRQAYATKIKTQAQLLGALDNLVKANAVNRVYLVVEESLQLLFDIDRSLILLPEYGGKTMRAHGSLRNTVVRKLRHQRLPIEPDSWLAACLRTMEPITLSSAEIVDDNKLMNGIFNNFAAQFLYCQPFTVMENHRGLLLLALDDKQQPLLDSFAETLRLITAQLGHRLMLEQMQRQHIEGLVRSRLQAQIDIARSIAGEIARPLAAIEEDLTVLTGKQKTAGDHKELANIARETGRIKKISDQLNELGESAKTESHAPVNLNELLANLIELFRTSNELRPGISLTLDIAANLPTITADGNTISKILHNLLDNSCEAVADDGDIRISASLYTSHRQNRESELIIAVTDNGSGVPESIRPHLFQAGRTTKGQGHTGLGLVVAKKLTNDLGGKIQYQRNNNETIFSLHLPLFGSFQRGNRTT
jgi:HD-like signal output (HDOD) protein/signal transduction histidine kinase